MTFLEKLMESEDGVGNKHYKRDFIIAISAISFLIVFIVYSLIKFI